MTQRELARKVAVSQPTISKFESAKHPSILAAPVRRRIAEVLNLHPDALQFDDRPSAIGTFGFCSKDSCPSNFPYAIGPTLRYVPTIVRLSRTQSHCAYCGAKLESLCPHCDQPIVPGRAACGGCGHALVTDTDADPKAPRDVAVLSRWIATRRTEIGLVRAQFGVAAASPEPAVTPAVVDGGGGGGV